MEVTVKTLDSQTKTFQVEAELTVKDFKKKVAEEMGIPIEKQRLIFQGKVLQDEKTLQEYKVNGCVIHLVEKQPPRNTRPNEQNWLRQKFPEEALESLTADVLAQRLTKFYQEVKKSATEHYSLSAHLAIRAAIDRYLTSEPLSKDFSIVRTPCFKQANKSLNAKLKNLRACGLSRTRFHTISVEDIQKCYERKVFGDETPLALLRVNWFNITSFFCRSPRDDQRSLTPKSFVIKKDINGVEYITISGKEQEETEQHDELKMYSTSNSHCPVRYFYKLLSVLNPSEKALFQRPKRRHRSTNKVWFKNSPLGVNTLATMMKEISMDAELSKIYTNQCVRSTPLSILDAWRLPRNITMVTVQQPGSLDVLAKACSAKVQDSSTPCIQIQPTRQLPILLPKTNKVISTPKTFAITTRRSLIGTETTTTSTPSTTSQGNMFMGAFAFPVDVMGVTQQIVQGIIQQIGAESAQANISTTSSGDGAAVNVHINLSTVMARNNARSRIAPALVHLGHVSNIINRLQNEGMLTTEENEETGSNSQSGGNQSENDTDCTPEDLADVLQRVVTIHEEMRPHLERYQELLRSSNRQLRPGDDMLPDLAAEALHSLSHAYHALSDVTTNFGVPEARLNVLPSVSPVPTPGGRTHMRTSGPVHGTTVAGTPAAATSTTGPAAAMTSVSPTMVTGVRVNSSGNGRNGNGLPNGNGMLNRSRLLIGNGNPVASSSPATSTPGTQQGNPHPFVGLPINVRNLPNLAVQFNPSAGNITIAHIMTTTVDESPQRATTTTTNSTPAPRTSSRGSIPVPPAPPAPPVHGSSAQTRPSTGGMDGSSFTTPGPTASSTPPTSTTTSFPGAQNNTVLNFLPPNAGHRDPLLPCQSFHFASLTPRPVGGGELPFLEQLPQNGQAEQRQARATQPQNQQSYPAGNVTGIPGPDLIQHLLNIGQRATTENVGPGTDSNPFLEFFRQPSQPTNAPSRYPGDLRIGSTTSTGTYRTTTSQTTAGEHATSSDDEHPGTLSRFLRRITEEHHVGQLFPSMFDDSSAHPWIVMRPMTQDFLRNDILKGDEPTAEKLQRATETILEELKSSFDSTFASSRVKDNIDITATLLTYFRPKIRRILELVNSSVSDEEYGTEMNDLLSRMSSECIALVEYCLQDGSTGLKTIFKRLLVNSPVMVQLDPPEREAVVSLWWSCVDHMRNSDTIREASLMPFVVRKEKRKHNGTVPSPKVARKDTSSKRSTSPSPSTSSTSSTKTTAADPAEDVAMSTDEDWKKVIPPEWVPVISQDIMRQRRLPRQPPFSDAYISGMPPKRRRLMTPAEPAPYSQCVSATLKRSIAKAGVKPKTDIELISREASSSRSLGKVFEQEVKNQVRERLSKDTDYQSEKFPCIHKYFESNN